MQRNIVKTRQGFIEGIAEGESIVFKGIPYAQPPVGELRWRRPQPPKPWEGVFRADHFGNRCAQDEHEDSFYHKEFYDEDGYKTPVSEDGLYLNVWVPKKASGTPFPVAFYIHGGAFLGGCGHEVEFRTDAFAKKGVILVTINYRLGIFGFLSHPWLACEDAMVCGNYGLLDQIAALRWVRENIAVFGGDPENITIFGQSAGGMSVQALLSVECARGLFSKAIIQSGAGYPMVIQQELSFEDSLAVGQFSQKVAKVSSLEELRALSTEELYQLQGKAIGMSMAAGKGLPFTPVANSVIRQKSYDELIACGEIADVPMIIGSNKNDITVTPEEAKSKRSVFRERCLQWAFAMEDSGHAPVYVYFFEHDLPGDNAGAFHSAELWYVFGTLGRCWRPMAPKDYEISERMVSYWTNFMKNASPNSQTIDFWPVCTKKNDFEMKF